MKLSRYFRQNSRVLLMVFMSLLLVAFLIPQTIQGVGGEDEARKQKIGQAFGRKITYADLQRADSDIAVLQFLGLFGNNVPTEESRIYYYLLMQEAQQMGIRINPDEAKSMLTGGEQIVQELQRSRNMSYTQIYDVVARWLAFRELISLQAGAVVQSLPRMEAEYRDQKQEAVTEVSLLDDKAFLSRVPEPSEEQIQAFFNEAKDRVTKHTADKLEFGYQLPDRVQVEYLTVDPNQVRDRITVQAPQAKKWYEEHRAQYTKPNPAAAQPGGEAAAPIQMTFEEARDKVRADYRADRAVEEAQKLINDVYNAAYRPWRLSGRDEQGFNKAPADPPPALEELKKPFEINYPIEYRKLDQMGATDLSLVPGFGRAGLPAGRQPIAAAQIALRVKGILPQDPNDGEPVLNINEPVVVFGLMPTIVGRQIQYVPRQPYMFRVVQVAPAAAPEMNDKLRKQVVEDWKLNEAHKLAGQYAEKLAARAREVGLKKAVEDATELKDILVAAETAATQPAAGETQPAMRYVPAYAADLQPFQPTNLTRTCIPPGMPPGRRTPYLQPKIGDPGNLPREVFKLAEAAAEAGQSNKVAAVSMPHSNRWAIVQFLELKPLYADDFQKQLASDLQSGPQNAVTGLNNEWMRPENIATRTHYVPEIGSKPQKS